VCNQGLGVFGGIRGFGGIYRVLFSRVYLVRDQNKEYSRASYGGGTKAKHIIILYNIHIYLSI
jgi:hypothetical protein